MCSIWAPSRWQHNRRRSMKLTPILSKCLPTYLLFDAKSQLLQSPGPTPVNLDILNSWLRCHVDVSRRRTPGFPRLCHHFPSPLVTDQISPDSFHALSSLSQSVVQYAKWHYIILHAESTLFHFNSAHRNWFRHPLISLETGRSFSTSAHLNDVVHHSSTWVI